MKIKEISDLITDATFEKVFAKKPEILNMKKMLTELTEKKVDSNIIFNVINNALQPNGYPNFISYVKSQKYVLNSTFKTARKNGLIVSQIEFLKLVNNFKNQGLFNAFLNIANEYVEKPEFDKAETSKIIKTETTKNFTEMQDALFLKKEKTLKKELDVLDYILYDIKQKSKSAELQRLV